MFQAGVYKRNERAKRAHSLYNIIYITTNKVNINNTELKDKISDSAAQGFTIEGLYKEILVITYTVCTFTINVFT